MSYPGAPYWPPEYDDDWCPGQDLDMDMGSCNSCPFENLCPYLVFDEPDESPVAATEPSKCTLDATTCEHAGDGCQVCNGMGSP